MGSDEGRVVSLDDGGELFIVEHGSGYPVMLLHGGVRAGDCLIGQVPMVPISESSMSRLGIA